MHISKSAVKLVIRVWGQEHARLFCVFCLQSTPHHPRHVLFTKKWFDFTNSIFLNFVEEWKRKCDFFGSVCIFSSIIRMTGHLADLLHSFVWRMKILKYPCKKIVGLSIPLSFFVFLFLLSFPKLVGCLINFSCNFFF